MALSWPSLETTIDILPTKKAFFGKYIFALKLHLVEGYLLRDWKVDGFTVPTEHRPFSSFVWDWERGTASPLPAKSRAQLVDMLMALKASREKTHVVNNGWSLLIYSNDEQCLYDIAKVIDPNSSQNRIESIHLPSSAAAAEALQPDVIFSNVPFKYKVYTREYRIAATNKPSLLKAMQNAGIQVNKRLFESLSTAGSYVASSYFYTDDDRICILLQLIDPKFVRRIYQIQPEPA